MTIIISFLFKGGAQRINFKIEITRIFHQLKEYNKYIFQNTIWEVWQIKNCPNNILYIVLSYGWLKNDWPYLKPVITETFKFTFKSVVLYSISWMDKRLFISVPQIWNLLVLIGNEPHLPSGSKFLSFYL